MDTANPMDISIIIPVLQEQAGIGDCLDCVLSQPGFCECIVVDGGSQDRTVDIARAYPVQVVAGPRGRGPQMNAGAARARGDVLLFLHADVVLPEHAARAVARTLRDPDVVAGAFRTFTVPENQLHGHGPARTHAPAERPKIPRVPLGPLLHLADFRSRYSRLPYGDQAMFIRADIFRAVGGFPGEPLMEDLALSRRLWSFGPVRIAPERVRVSGRRFESAPLLQTLWVNSFPLLHALGVPTAVLARIYGNPR